MQELLSNRMELFLPYILFAILHADDIKPFPYHQIHVFDFQPMDPENIYVALAALSGRSVAGGHMNLCCFMCFRSFH